MTKKQAEAADKRFWHAWKIKQALITHAQHRLNECLGSREYKKLRAAYCSAKDGMAAMEKKAAAAEKALADAISSCQKKKERKARKSFRAAMRTMRAYEKQAKASGKRMEELHVEHGLTKEGFEAFVAVKQKEYEAYVSSHQAQKIADQVFTAAEGVLYRDGRVLRHRPFMDFRTISSKSMNGCHYMDRKHPNQFKKDRAIYPDGQAVWMGDTIKVKIDWHDQYVCEALEHELSYCEVHREPFPDGWHYYVILVLDGDPPERLAAIGNGVAGIDAGVSTMCMVSDTAMHFDELAPKCRQYDKEISKAQAEMEAIRRRLNPGNYNADGTIKKGRHRWATDKHYKKLRFRYMDLCRRKKAYTKTMHHELANTYMMGARSFIVEDMDYRALAKRSKKPAERQEKVSVIRQGDGTAKEVRKFKKKRRFGKSVMDRSPGLFLSVLEGKAARAGGMLLRIDPKKPKASQYRHDTDTYKKAALSARTKMIDGRKVYRDPYSAFLLKNLDLETMTVDRGICLYEFGRFLEMQEQMASESKMLYPDRPKCFGF